MQELVGGLAVDGVGAVEEFDFGFVAEAEFVVVAADLGVFPSAHSSSPTPWPCSTMKALGIMRLESSA